MVLLFEFKRIVLSKKLFGKEVIQIDKDISEKRNNRQRDSNNEVQSSNEQQKGKTRKEVRRGKLTWPSRKFAKESQVKRGEAAIGDVAAINNNQ